MNMNKDPHDDIEIEIHTHLELETRERTAEGMSEEEARRAARRAFGNVTRIQEEVHELWRWIWLERAIQDLRYAYRTLRNSPGFVAVAVLSLALGIGANTAIFTLINAALLKPLPIHDPSRLVSVYTADERNPQMTFGTSRDNYIDIRDSNNVFDHTATSARIAVNLSGGTGQPERVIAELVSGNYFDTLATFPVIGRGFLPEEDQTAGASLVTVLSHDLWQTRFGGDPSIVGRTILVNNQPFLVAGVMAPGFRGTTPLLGTMLWVPYMTYPVTTNDTYRNAFSSRRFTPFEIIGRLKPDVTIEQVDANLKAIARQLAVAYPNDNGERTLVTLNAGGFILQTEQSVRTTVGMLLAIVTVVLFVACINVANLLLARMTVRHREIAIRQSIGATRSRLVRQFITEGVLLTAVSTLAGLLVAKVALGVFWEYRPPFFDANALDLRLDLRVLAFTMAVSFVTCLLFALAPAIKASRGNANELTTRGIGGNERTLGVRHFLIAAQVALSLIALISAGLFLRSLQRAIHLDPGVALDQIAMLSFDLGAQGYNEGQGRALQREMLDRVAALNGVEGVVLADLVPIAGGGYTRSIYLEGEDPNDRRNGYIIPTGVVGPGYFDVLGIPLLSGRDFAETDTPSTPVVVIVNEAMVDKFWPGQNPIGKRVKFLRSGFFEVVGVVKNSAYNSIGAPPTPTMYRALTQAYQAQMSILVRSKQPEEVLGLVRNQIQQLDPRLPLTNVMSLDGALRQSLWGARLGASLLTVLGSISLVLAIIGIYGVMAYSVNQRRQEIGLRLALGANPGSVQQMVLGQSLRLALAGVAGGVLISLGATRFIANLLYGSATDSVSFLGASVIVVAAALAASYLPARCATRIDPVIALRTDA
jgi:putative ABC transport system permease protein